METASPSAANRRPRTVGGWLILLGFFAALLLTGLLLYRDYGVSWDGPLHRRSGAKAWNYVFAGDRTYQKTGMRIYGQVLEVPLAGIERALGLVDRPRDAHRMRHLASFLVFYAGVVFFFLLCRKRFRSWKLGLLGAFLFVLSPRIFGDAFHNLKDIGTMVFFIISFLTLLRFVEKPGLLRASLHALACAALIGIRIVGVAVPVITIILLVIELLASSHRVNADEASTRSQTRRLIASAVFFLVLGVGFTVLLWPTLWQNPLGTFTYAIRRMARYSFPDTSLYFGEFITAAQTPWHYTPVWMAITTPVAYILLFASGFGATVLRLVLHPVRFYLKHHFDLAFVMWFLGPLVAVAVLRSTLYDGWRHMFFVYPAFLLLALVGVELLLSVAAKWPRRRRAITIGVLAIPFLGALEAACFTARYHPHENVFFNVIAGSDMAWVKRNFELDYWGLSYFQGLEYIARTDPRDEIRIHMGRGWRSALEALRPEDRKRMKFAVVWDSPDYVLGNYRWHNREYDYSNEVFSVKVRGERIMVAYDLRPHDPYLLNDAVHELTAAVEEFLPDEHVSIAVPQVSLADERVRGCAASNDKQLISFGDLYRAMAKPEDAEVGLPVLAIWAFGQEYHIPAPLWFMEDGEHYVSGGYAFTFLGTDPDGLVGAYLVTAESDLPQ